MYRKLQLGDAYVVEHTVTVGVTGTPQEMRFCAHLFGKVNVSLTFPMRSLKCLVVR